ncbi:cytochrome b5 [Panus rudis PR-1116 ss-1]|nr:cytochrome b5 [Panus rudis PR-1116 ss-1]
MASYLRSWLSTQTPNPIPKFTKNTLKDEDDDADTVRGDDDNNNEDDSPPAFPSLNSAQRAGNSTSSSVPSILTDSDRMPPPPLPALATRRPGISASSSLGVPSTASSLTATTTTKAPAKKSKKVALAPGHGPLDWANLKKSGQDLRGVDTLMRIPMSVLKQHNKREDAWSAFNGKVYNITPYLPYHPGGERELLRVAGRDGTRLFSLYCSFTYIASSTNLFAVSTHAWVNLDYMLDACLVGFLVPDS